MFHVGQITWDNVDVERTNEMTIKLELEGAFIIFISFHNIVYIISQEPEKKKETTKKTGSAKKKEKPEKKIEEKTKPIKRPKEVVGEVKPKKIAKADTVSKTLKANENTEKIEKVKAEVKLQRKSINIVVQQPVASKTKNPKKIKKVHTKGADTAVADVQVATATTITPTKTAGRGKKK